MLPYGEVQVYL